MTPAKKLAYVALSTHNPPEASTLTPLQLISSFIYFLCANTVRLGWQTAIIAQRSPGIKATEPVPHYKYKYIPVVFRSSD